MPNPEPSKNSLNPSASVVRCLQIPKSSFISLYWHLQPHMANIMATVWKGPRPAIDCLNINVAVHVLPNGSPVNSHNGTVFLLLRPLMKPCHALAWWLNQSKCEDGITLMLYLPKDEWCRRKVNDTFLNFKEEDDEGDRDYEEEEKMEWAVSPEEWCHSSDNRTVPKRPQWERRLKYEDEKEKWIVGPKWLSCLSSCIHCALNIHIYELFHWCLFETDAKLYFCKDIYLLQESYSFSCWAIVCQHI